VIAPVVADSPIEIGKFLDSTGCGIRRLSILGSAWPVFRPVDGGHPEVCTRTALPGSRCSNRNFAEKLPETKTPSIGHAARFLRRTQKLSRIEKSTSCLF
jgi:hypothetical protein